MFLNLLKIFGSGLYKFFISLRRRITCIICIVCLFLIIVPTLPTIVAHFYLLFLPSSGACSEYNFEKDSNGNFRFYSTFWIDLPHSISASRDLSYSAYLFRLEYISISDMQLTEQFFLSTSRHKKLEHLYLNGCQFESHWLSHLSACKNIGSIFVLNCKSNISPQRNIIRSIEKNQELNHLVLMNVEITEDDIISLNKLTNLSNLVLSSCTFQTNQTAEELCDFVVNKAVNMLGIRLVGVPATEKYLQAIIDKPTLDNVHIENNSITDEIISNIKIPTGQMKDITIKSNSISDVGLLKIHIEPNIFLTLEDTTITETAWNNFLQANPTIEDCFYRKDKVTIKHR
jgi:hypothetical protein